MGPELVTSQAYILRVGKPPAAASFKPRPLCILFASWDYHSNKTTPKHHVQVGFPPF